MCNDIKDVKDMKIDLHCHTKKIKKGDPTTRNVTAELFKEKITRADIRIAAITNHNHFDVEQYKQLRDCVEECCDVWPGVELDIVGQSQKRGHLIVVANPDNLEQFNSSVRELINNQDENTVVFSLDEVYKNLDKCDVIYIFHYNKTPSVDEEDIEELRSKVSKKARIFGEPSNLRSLGVYANLGGNVIMGSDVRDWSDYENKKFSELRLPVSSFAQFCKLAEKDETVVNTLLGSKTYNEYTANPYPGVSIKIPLYRDVNIIFGQKGTGKSEILKSLISVLRNQGVKCETYIGGNRETQFGEFLKTSDMTRLSSKVGVDECSNEFNYIMKFREHMPTLFSDYLEWYETKDNSKNKQRMKITEARITPQRDPSIYDEYKEESKTSQAICGALSKIRIEEYFSEEESEQFRKLAMKLVSATREAQFAELVLNESVMLANKSIETIKNIADKHTNTKSKPSTTGFTEYTCARIQLKKCVDRILKSIEADGQHERMLIGTIENKGKIYIQSTYKMLDAKSRREEFNIGINKLKRVKELLKDLSKQWFANDISSVLSELKEICDKEGIVSTSSFLGLSKQTILENGEEYNPSSGEKSILLLQKVLNTAADAYLLDEPELGMGNSYIDSTIRPQLVALAKQRKIVVVATHNANLAVRTLPYCSILRTHDSGVYSTYVGNPFNDHLVNILNKDDIKSWAFESMHTLEGGHEAFYERKEIYESGSV